MPEDENAIYGIDTLADILDAYEIEHDMNEEDHSLVFVDGAGSPHECWAAGVEPNLVNVVITIAPEQVLSVGDLNGVIAENEKLRIALKALIKDTHHELCEGRDSYQCKQCSMNRNKDKCIMTDAMDLFNDDEMCELLMADNQREEEL